MTDMKTVIEYVFALKDDTSATAKVMSDSAQEADESVKQLKDSEVELRIQTDETTMALDRQQVNILTQLTALMGMKESVSAVTSGLIGLGLVSDDTAQKLGMVNAGFSLLSGAVTGIKALQAVMTTLNATTAINGVITSFTAMLKNPAAMAGVGIAMGTAAGVAGAFLLTQNTSNNRTANITVMDTTPQAATNEIFQIVNGGAL